MTARDKVVSVVGDFWKQFCLIIPLTLQWSFIFRNGKEHKGAAVCRFIPSRMQQCIFGSQLTEVLPGCHDAREKADPTTTHRPLSQNLKTEAKKFERIFRDATPRQDRCKLHPLKRWTIICGNEKWQIRKTWFLWGFSLVVNKGREGCSFELLTPRIGQNSNSNCATFLL